MWFAVLALEILFYSVYMYSVEKKNFLKYIVIFTIGTILIVILQKVKILAYLLFGANTLIGMSIIKSNKSSNILKVLVMILYKLGIEILLTFLVYSFIKDVLTATTIVSMIKIILTLILSRIINKANNKIEKLWNQNNFYIRYITTIILMIYIVATCIYLIKYWL